MTELVQDGVEHDAAERIVLDAEQAQRRHRLGRQCIGIRPIGACSLDARQHHRQREGRAAAAARRDLDVAAHAAGKLLDRGQAEACAAEARGDRDVGLRERPEQPPDLGQGHADAAIGHREGDADPALFGAYRRGLERDKP